MTLFVRGLARWGKFNLVGAIGMGIQTAALAAFNRVMAGHYLYAAAAAIEVTLLHNFAWHWHYTWRDRRNGLSAVDALLRFHLSNGLVSIFGNLALMRILVREARLPLLLANCIAVLCCSVANFFLGNRWAFTTEVTPAALKRPKAATAPFVVAALLAGTLLTGTMPVAQAQKSHAAQRDASRGLDGGVE